MERWHSGACSGLLLFSAGMHSHAGAWERGGVAGETQRDAAVAFQPAPAAGQAAVAGGDTARMRKRLNNLWSTLLLVPTLRVGMRTITKACSSR